MLVGTYVYIGGVQMNNKDTKILTLIFGILGAISFLGIFIIVLALENNCIDDLTALKIGALCAFTLFLSYKILEFTEDLIYARKNKIYRK